MSYSVIPAKAGIQALSVLLCFVLFSSCAAKPESHSTTGVIQVISPDKKSLTIAHEEFSGFMEAMTMTFEVESPALAQGLQPGDRVRFTITKKGDSWPVTSMSKLP